MRSWKRWSTVVILTVIVLVVSGCGAPTPEAVQGQAVEQAATVVEVAEETAVPTAEPTPKVLTIGHHVEPRALEPFLDTTAAFQSVNASTIEQLVYFTPDGRDVVPWLAESWAWEDEGRTLVLNVKQGVKFHNGEAFGAEAAKFCIERLMDAKSYVQWTELFESVEVVGDYAIAIHFSEVEGSALAVLARASYVYAPEYYTQVGAEAFGQAPVGTGPYQFEDWVIGDHVTLKAFPDYWGGTPKLDQVVWRFIPEQAARIAALETGEVDLITNLTAGVRPQIENNPDLEVLWSPGLRMFGTFFDTRLDHPVADAKVRRALNYAVDKDGLVALFDGDAVKLHGQLQIESVLGWNPDVDPFDYDPDKARALLAEAGYPDGFEMDLKYTTNRYPLDTEIGQAVAGYLEDIGIKVNQIPLEYGEFSRQFREEESMGPTMQWGFLFAPDPHMAVVNFRPGTDYNRWPDNPRANELIQAGRATTDPVEREKIYQELRRIWNDDPIAIYLVVPNDLYAIRKSITGFVPSVMQVVWLWDVDLAE